jgi:iron complex outermembrane recepter protein
MKKSGVSRLSGWLFTGLLLAADPQAFAQETPPPEETPEQPAETPPEEAPPPEAPPPETPPEPLPEVVPPPPPEAPPPEAIVEPAPPPVVSGKVTDIYVTGSSVRRVDLVTPAPVTVLNREDLDASGLMSVGEILQNLPIQANAVNVQTNNSGDGTTRVDLRGIGASRTLVLLNGRRMVPGGLGADDSVNVNVIPVEIIERIEILKDGASAIYGSDAIAGVVNIITKKDYAGIEAASYLGGTRKGGLTYSLAVTAGETSERASFMLSFQYFKQQDILNSERDFSKTDQNFDYETGKPIDEGSYAPPQGVIFDYGEDDGNAAWQEIVRRYPDASGIWINDAKDGWRVLRETGNQDTGTGDLYNYQPENYLTIPSDRFSLYGQGNYRISDRINAYFEALYTGNHSAQQLAPEPIFTYDEGVAVSADNVYNPFGRDFIDIARRPVEGTPRTFDQDFGTFRAVVGLNGTYPEGLGFLSQFRWDANFVYGVTQGTDTNFGSFNRIRLRNAIGPSFFDENGVAMCGTPDAPIEGCVPLNLFGGPGSITPEMLQYLQYKGIRRGYSDQRVLTLGTDGELFKILDQSVSLAIGYQNRRESGGSIPDPLTAAGDSTGGKDEPVEGAYLENAGYAELNVPFAFDVVGAKVIELNGAFRLFDYDTYGGDNMWKLGARWQVIDSIGLRGTYSKAFRAPNVSELYSGRTISFEDVADPCSVAGQGRTPEATQQCQREGVPDDFEDNDSQHRALWGGNPNLEPETANVATAGIVITPNINRWTDGLSLTADYFNIAIENAIQRVTADVILAQCYNQPDGERQYCDRISRNQLNKINLIDDPNTNLGGTNTSGIDLALVYALPTDYGRFDFSGDTTVTLTYEEVQVDGSVVDGQGVYDLQVVFPTLKMNYHLGWSYKGIGVGWNMRYLGPIKECENNDCSVPDARFRDVDANVTMDIYGQYSFANPLGLTTISAGINNFLDQDPPFIYEGFTGNSDSNNYDYIGRYFYMGLRHAL